MKRRKLLSNTAYLAMLALATVLILVGTIGGVQAALRIQSKALGASFEMVDLKTALVENEVTAEGADALLGDSFVTANAGNGLTSRADVKIGRQYDEVLKAENSGNVDQYVRVTVRRYWTDQDGKDVELDPDLIELHFVEGNGWTIDQAASTPERTVLYYASVLTPGERTSEFVDKITINSQVLVKAHKLAKEGKLDYENVTFHVAAEVDAVQTHNGSEAMTSSWGRTNE